MEDRTEQERMVTQEFLSFIENHMGDVPAQIVAGAALRVAAVLAVESLGAEHGPEATRLALENVFNQLSSRNIQ